MSPTVADGKESVHLATPRPSSRTPGSHWLLIGSWLPTANRLRHYGNLPGIRRKLVNKLRYEQLARASLLQYASGWYRELETS